MISTYDSHIWFQRIHFIKYMCMMLIYERSYMISTHDYHIWFPYMISVHRCFMLQNICIWGSYMNNRIWLPHMIPHMIICVKPYMVCGIWSYTESTYDHIPSLVYDPIYDPFFKSYTGFPWDVLYRYHIILYMIFLIIEII